jgi:serine/threonine protein kinase
MVIANQCPEPLNLDRYASGRAPASEADAIARHVASCETCRLHVETARADDRFLRSIRAELLAAATGAAAPSISRRDLPVKDEPLPRISGLRVLRELGRGGMGIVYEAEQDHPRRRVAVKVIRDARSASPEHIARFRREVDALGALQHPGIATVYHAGTTDDGDPYFTMELVEGRTLGEVAPSLPLQSRLRLFVRVCEAVQFAHDRAVVHRDLKPANILIALRPGGDAESAQLRLVDFGLAHLGGDDGEMDQAALTRPGHVQGTPRYMSPEQISGRRRPLTADRVVAERASDIYSLGVILYELATGQPAFDFTNTSWYGMARAVCEACFPAPSAVNSGIRGALERVILRAMATRPEERHASAGELGAEVRRTMEAGGASRRLRIPRVHLPRPRAWRIGLAVSALVLAALATIAGPMWPGVRRASSSPQLAAGPALLHLDRDLSVSPAELESKAAQLRAALTTLSGEHQPKETARLVMELAMIHEAAGRYEEARMMLQRLMETGRRTPEVRGLGLMAMVRLARVLHESGRLADARMAIGRARAAISSAPRPAPAVFQSELCATHAAILADLGDLGPAERMLAEASRHAAAGGGPAPWLQLRLDAAAAVVTAARERAPAAATPRTPDSGSSN